MRQRQAGFGEIQGNGQHPVRGVVVSISFADQQQEREESARQRDPRFTAVTSVCASVLIYGGRTRAFLVDVPILPRRHGINDYTGLWIPRPSTKDLSTGAAPVLTREPGGPAPSNPKDLDGDHVLVEFAAGDVTQAFIRDSFPHPRANHRQLVAAAEAWESRFHGAVTKVDKDGNVLVDTTLASDGAVDGDGTETPADNDAHGTVTLRLAQHAPLVIEHVSPDGTVTKSRFSIDPDGKTLSWQVDGGEGLRVVDKDGNTIATVGNGAEHAANAEQLKIFYDSVKAALDLYGPHLHPSAMGPTGTPVPPLVLPPFLELIKSSKLRIPPG